MRLKTLLFNRGIFIQNIRAVGWIAIGYLLCLIFAIPLQILMITSTNDRYHYLYEFTGGSLFRFLEAFQFLLMFTIPVLLAIFLFRYLQVKLSADFVHSLPINREALYHQHIILGITMLVVPVLLNGLILLFLSSVIDVPNVLNVKTILAWVFTTSIVNIFVFMASVFVAMFTGISVFQGVLTYILLVFPAGVTMLFFMNVRYFLHGFAVDYYLDRQIEKLVPFVKVGNLTQEPFLINDHFGFIIISFVFYITALVVYKKRKVEMATQAVAFKVLQPVFLYGVTFCMMLLSGMYFGETQGTFGWRLFGYIVGSLIGYIVAQMILEKTWRIFHKWKGIGIYTVFMLVLVAFIRFDLFGYENRVPDIMNVERVYFGQSVMGIEDVRERLDYKYMNPNRFYYEDKNNIETIIAIHEDIVSNKRPYGDDSRHYRQAIIAYELTNGRKLVRSYQVPTNFYNKPSERLAELMESDEYKRNHFLVLQIRDTNGINQIRISSYRSQGEVVISDPHEIEEFHQVLTSDIKGMTVEDIVDERSAWANIEYIMDNQEDQGRWLNIEWKKSYEQVEAWLRERDLESEARVTSADIDYVIIAKMDYPFVHDYRKFYGDVEKFEETTNGIRIEDDEEIEVILRASSWNDEGDFIVAYYYKDDLTYPNFETLKANHVPKFILDRLQ